MKIEKTLCPYCGASLKIRPGQKYAECEYCGNSSLITGTAGSTAEAHNTAVNETPRTDVRKTAAAAAADPVRTPRPDQTRRAEAKKHKLFPPPGFREKNFLKILGASIGYLFLLLVAFELGTPSDTLCFLIASLSVIDICTDWTGLYSRLKGVHSPNTGVRIIMKIVWSTIVFFAWVALLVIIQSFRSL